MRRQRKSILRTVSVLNTEARRRNHILRTREARRAGATSRQLTALVRAQILLRPHRGVYVQPGHLADHAGRARAALAAVTRSTAASHRSAAFLQGLIDRPPAAVHLTAGGDFPRRRAGIVVHRSRNTGPLHRFAGVACTSPLRTLIDLAATASVVELDFAVDRALSQGLIRETDLHRLEGGRRGVGRLRASLRRRGFTGAPKPSVLESRMVRIFRAAGLPPPRAELRVGPDGRYRLDFAYPEIRLAVEGHGYAWHHTPEQVAQDLARHRDLTAREGWVVLAFTWKEIIDRPEAVTAEIAAARRRLTAAGTSSGAFRSASDDRARVGSSVPPQLPP